MGKRMPQQQRPTEIVCECGAIVLVGLRGRVPVTCRSCQERAYYASRSSIGSRRSLIYPMRCVGCSSAYIARRIDAKLCPACRIERDKHVARQWPAKAPLRAARNALAGQLRRHGLTIEQFESMLESQQGRCAICGTIDTAPKSRFCIDHDHACCPGAHSCGRCVRGLLCDKCNRMIAVDDPARLRAAADYIERHQGES